MPGFTSHGYKLDEAWDGAQVSPTEETMAEWEELKRNGFFTVSGNPTPQGMRMTPLPDLNFRGDVSAFFKVRFKYV